MRALWRLIRLLHFAVVSAVLLSVLVALTRK
jgi:hypothetical protein